MLRRLRVLGAGVRRGSHVGNRRANREIGVPGYLDPCIPEVVRNLQRT